MVAIPTFMVIGASKCGTSTVCGHLRRHPDIFMVTPKEPHFFSMDERFAKGIEWYEALYDGATDEKQLGEGSNTYTIKEVYPQAANRIFKYKKDLRLVYCVRNPLPRIESCWLEYRAHLGETVHYDFNQALKVNKDRLIDSTNYWRQLEVYRELFGEENIHVIFFEDLLQNPDAVMQSCFAFLGVDTSVPLNNPDLHVGTTKGRFAASNTLSRLRENAMFRFAVRLAPAQMRYAIRNRLFLKRIDTRPTWSASRREWVASQLREDTLRFLEFYGKPVDYWELD
ncbi:sulfotransferase domain-containing protein [Aeoliella sp.]|uniref:sulfotransferase domain-containing protein n=1 Tax=Aeoliella sp. TaxID=2795800 RepID=UPI003CCC3ED1